LLGGVLGCWRALHVATGAATQAMSWNQTFLYWARTKIASAATATPRPTNVNAPVTRSGALARRGTVSRRPLEPTRTWNQPTVLAGSLAGRRVAYRLRTRTTIPRATHRAQIMTTTHEDACTAPCMFHRLPTRRLSMQSPRRSSLVESAQEHCQPSVDIKQCPAAPYAVDPPVRGAGWRRGCPGPYGRNVRDHAWRSRRRPARLARVDGGRGGRNIQTTATRVRILLPRGRRSPPEANHRPRRAARREAPARRPGRVLGPPP
jgi:hypothetical protein